jgi:hypothetical protein
MSIRRIDTAQALADTCRMKAKDQYLQIRVSPAEKTAIQTAAARAGMDMSGWVLAKLLPPEPQTFQAIVADLAENPAGRRYALAELNDFLANLGAAELDRAVTEPPALALEPYLANYVAAMVETAAHRADLAPPRWTAAVPALREPVFGTELVGLRLYLLLNSPPAFRRRNIFIDATVGERV